VNSPITFILGLAALAGATAPAYDAVGKGNPPIVTVKKELYKKHPKPRAAALVSVQYVGPKLERREWQGVEINDDVHDNQVARWSMDNGRTWSDFVSLQPSSNVVCKGVTVWEGGWGGSYDPKAGVLVEMWLRQIAVKGVYHNFTYYRVSRDLGRTWTAPKQLRYEAGDPFDLESPLKPAFLKHNQGYPGNNILVHSNGSLIHCVAHAKAPGDPRNEQRPWKMASLCFVGKWNAAAKDYEWSAGKRVEIAPEISSRGLMEPETAELKDGRVLVVWRGSNTSTTPGHKWFSLSGDGGRTLDPVRQWKYDDGTSFYSPSSYHRMIRHSVTKKLYWIGNICAEPPGGNSPRYPLVIAEVEETMPALKRKTVTVIDDRRPGQGAGIQFSNFSLLENRETHELELHLTTYGQEPDPKDWASADNYKFTLTIKK
jgi:hypothetical protein